MRRRKTKPVDKGSSVRFRLAAVDYLAAVKEGHKYDELSKKTGLAPAALSRYVNARVLPTEARARKLISQLSEIAELGKLVRSKVRVDGLGMVDDTKLLASTRLLKLAASETASYFADVRVDNVVTMASDGIPFATLLSELLGAPLTIAKKEREKGVKRFWNFEARIADTGLTVSAYAPIDSIQRGANCLIVDDLVRSGETQEALTGLVKTARGKVVGYSFLVAITDRWRERIENGKPVKVFTEL